MAIARTDIDEGAITSSPFSITRSGLGVGGSNRLAVIGLYSNENTTDFDMDTLTLGGVAFTEFTGSPQTQNFGRAREYYMPESAMSAFGATEDLVVDGNDDNCWEYAFYTGVDTSAGPDSVDTHTSNSGSSYSMSVTPSNANGLVWSFAGRRDNDTHTASGDITDVDQIGSAFFHAAAQAEELPAAASARTASGSWSGGNDRIGGLAAAWSPSSGAQTITPSGIASGEAFGSTTITVGGVTITVTGIASAEAFGTAVMELTLLLVGQGIPSAEAFGLATLALGAASIAPTGIASAEAFGSTTLVLGGVTITATGIPSGEAFGSATITQATILAPTGIGSGEAFGSHTINVGGVTIIPSGIVSGEAFGSHVIQTGVILIPSGIVSAEAFGTATVVPGGVTLLPPGIVSSEAFGTNLIVLGGGQQFAADTILHLWRFRKR